MQQVVESPRAGEVVGNRYRLIAELDRGGQGTIYRGVDMRDGDEVAVKVLQPNANDAEWRERTFREVHALTVLTGTAAVRVFHQAWTHDGAFCIVMELLHGMDLEEVLQKRAAAGERMDARELCQLLEPIVDTLEVAHAAGILHRDLKPGNVFVTDSGAVRLLDFGFAKFTRMRRVTQEGMVAGSPSYIAPEIWQDASQLDQRIDVYSLAAVVFRALAGKPPFSGRDLREVLSLVTTAKRPSLHALRPDLPPEIDTWVEHALAIAPADRFHSARALWNALSSLLSARSAAG
jgi:eukaryotic-like serine/threonine-protein kinase